MSHRPSLFDAEATPDLWSRRRLVLIALVFAAAWASFGLPWLSGRVTIPYDAKAHFQAQIQFLANALHTGQSPFWTPNVFGGSPQIADPQSLIFSPAFLLAWFDAVPSFQRVDAFVLTLLGLGGFAILMFFKDRNWHPAGAMVAGLAFAFGGAAAWRIQHVGQVMSFAQFGITLWLLARALDRSSIRYGLLSGLSAALMVVKPDQVGLLGVYVLAAYVLNHWLTAEHRKAALVASLRPLTAGAVAAAVLAAGPLLLTLLFAEASQRAEISYTEAIRGSLHPASMLTAMIADLFGAGDLKVDYWGPSSAAWDPGELSLSQNMGEIYFGAIPVLAILTVGATRGLLWNKDVRFFTLAALACIFYALGKYTPVFHLLYEYMPGVKGFRRPADATFMIGGLGAIIGGYVIHRWLTEDFRRPGLARTAFKGLVLIGLFALAAFLAYRHGHLADAVKPIMVSAAILCAGLLLVKSSQVYLRQAPVLSAAALAAFMVYDLGVNNGPNESTGLPPASYDVLDPATRNPTIAILKQKLRQANNAGQRDRVELLGVGFAWPNLGMVHSFDHVLGYNPLRLREFVEVAGAGDTIAGPDQRVFTPLMTSYGSLFADLIGLRWIASSVPIETVDKNLRPGDLRLIARTQDAFIYENPNALPRAMFVRGWKLADFERLTETGRWPDFNPQREVLLESLPEEAAPVQVTGLAEVRIRSYENTRVEIEVETPDPGFVLLNDVWHRWWTANIDGEEADILKANVLFRAVQVPAGKHKIVFEFKPIEGAFAELRERLTGEATGEGEFDTP
ncbi:MAG: YfhO family protein [Proteobacteria bacterium]|nr:YfhO family protein [Pseudomonadota bacterium]